MSEKYAAIEQSPIVASRSLQHWFELVNEFNRIIHQGDTARQRERLTELGDSYRETKTRLLTTVVDETISVRAIDIALQVASQSRRFIEQVLQAKEAYLRLSHNLLDKSCQGQDTGTELLEPNIKEQSIVE